MGDRYVPTRYWLNASIGKFATTEMLVSVQLAIYIWQEAPPVPPAPVSHALPPLPTPLSAISMYRRALNRVRQNLREVAEAAPHYIHG